MAEFFGGVANTHWIFLSSQPQQNLCCANLLMEDKRNDRIKANILRMGDPGQEKER